MSVVETVGPKAIAAAFALVCGGIGGAIGYSVAKRKYADLADQEIAEAKQYYADKFTAVTDSDEMITYKQAASRYSGEEPPVKGLDVLQENLEEIRALNPDDAESVLRTIQIIEDNESWDWDHENAHRDVTLPHVIHIDEFNDNGLNHSQVEMIWYEGDDMLTDEDGVSLDPYRYIGADNVRFGHGSADANLVYIRNVDLEIDICLRRNTGSYVVQVLGIQP